METPARTPFPRTWTHVGWAVLAVFSLFAGRILYEETLLTASDGPQMVGFAMMHGAVAPIFFAGLLGLPSALLWIVVSAGFLIRKRLPSSPSEWAPLILLPSLFILLLIPYSIWKEVVVRLDGPGYYGMEYMTEAAAEGNVRFVSYLLNHGMEVNPNYTGAGTPLSAAAVGGHEPMIRLLISKGADVNGKEGTLNETPLMGAAQMPRLGPVKLLIENGAAPCELDRDGQTAESLARKYKHPDIAAYLSQFHCQEHVIPCEKTPWGACVH